MLEVVEHHLKKHGFRCVMISGNTPVAKRADIVQSFNTDARGPTVKSCIFYFLKNFSIFLFFFFFFFFTEREYTRCLKYVYAEQ